MKELIIIGASGFGREVAWLAERINQVKPEWNIVGFLDDNTDIQDTIVDGYKVIGTINDINKYSDSYFVCAIGSSKVRKKIIERILEILPNINFATLIDPSAIISDRVKMGHDCVVCAGNIITVDIVIGNHVIVNLDCTIGHDAVIHDFTTLYPSVNVSGCSNISECVELGTGCQVIQGKTIGAGTIVGAGAVVVKNLPSECTAVGLPAKPIKFH